MIFYTEVFFQSEVHFLSHCKPKVVRAPTPELTSRKEKKTQSVLVHKCHKVYLKVTFEAWIRLASIAFATCSPNYNHKGRTTCSKINGTAHIRIKFA